MDIATTVEAAAAAIGVVSLLGGGIFSAGKFKQVMDANTKALEKLGVVFDKFSSDTDKTLLNHEVRISVIEGTRGNVAHDQDIRITKLEAKEEQ
jgi:hypothetical protein